jgi:hypothetical protein
MRYSLVAVVFASVFGAAVAVSGQAIIERGKPIVVRGEIVDVACYQKKGAAEGTGAAHAECAAQCAREGKMLALLSDGEGLYKLVGPMTQANNAKLIPFLGKVVDVSGTSVLLSNSYDIRQSIEVAKVTPVAK